MAGDIILNIQSKDTLTDIFKSCTPLPLTVASKTKYKFNAHISNISNKIQLIFVHFCWGKNGIFGITHLEEMT